MPTSPPSKPHPLIDKPFFILKANRSERQAQRSNLLNAFGIFVEQHLMYRPIGCGEVAATVRKVRIVPGL